MKKDELEKKKDHMGKAIKRAIEYMTPAEAEIFLDGVEWAANYYKDNFFYTPK